MEDIPNIKAGTLGMGDTDTWHGQSDGWVRGASLEEVEFLSKWRNLEKIILNGKSPGVEPEAEEFHG